MLEVIFIQDLDKFRAFMCKKFLMKELIRIVASPAISTVSVDSAMHKESCSGDSCGAIGSHNGDPTRIGRLNPLPDLVEPEKLEGIARVVDFSAQIRIFQFANIK